MTINIKVMFDVHMLINQMIDLLRNKYSNHFIPGRDMTQTNAEFDQNTKEKLQSKRDNLR